MALVRKKPRKFVKNQHIFFEFGIVYINRSVAMIQQDFEYYTANQDNIVDGHLDEYVIIMNSRV